MLVECSLAQIGLFRDFLDRCGINGLFTKNVQSGFFELPSGSFRVLLTLFCDLLFPGFFAFVAIILTISSKLTKKSIKKLTFSKKILFLLTW
jgi:hypothetical protein